jgi:hypothetical protein
VELGTDFEVSAEDYAEYVAGENAEAAKPIQAEIVGPVTVREFPARSWSAQQLAVIGAAAPQQLASRIPQRTRLLIENTGANSVWVSSTREACSITNGFEIRSGFPPFEMNHSGEVYVVAAPALDGALSIYAEFRDGGV